MVKTAWMQSSPVLGDTGYKGHDVDQSGLDFGGGGSYLLSKPSDGTLTPDPLPGLSGLGLLRTPGLGRGLRS